MPDTRPPFHYAFLVHDLTATRDFYGTLLGCQEGRSSETWIDYDFHGHQIVAHLDAQATAGSQHRNPVDGREVPVPHFGLVLPWDVWHELADRLRAAQTKFVIEPTTRFRGEPGQQATMFLLDPAGNALEFKAFRDPENLFAT